MVHYDPEKQTYIRLERGEVIPPVPDEYLIAHGQQDNLFDDEEEGGYANADTSSSGPPGSLIPAAAPASASVAAASAAAVTASDADDMGVIGNNEGASRTDDVDTYTIDSSASAPAPPLIAPGAQPQPQPPAQPQQQPQQPQPPIVAQPDSSDKDFNKKQLAAFYASPSGSNVNQYLTHRSPLHDRVAIPFRKALAILFHSYCKSLIGHQIDNPNEPNIYLKEYYKKLMHLKIK
jgi:hypothetical protein